MSLLFAQQTGTGILWPTLKLYNINSYILNILLFTLLLANGKESDQTVQIGYLICVFIKCKKCSDRLIDRKKIRKRRLFKKVQAFCEEKVLRYLLGVFWYAESNNQCWQAEKWRLHCLISIFPRWPPNRRKIHKNL